MKLTTTAQVSVDGVMQGPGGPEEDERGRLERGGWAHFDDEASTVMDRIYQRAEAFLFGRRTYEIFAGSWSPGRRRRRPRRAEPPVGEVWGPCRLTARSVGQHNVDATP